MAGQLLHEQLDRNIVRTLIYFDIFRYPLKVEEVFRYLNSNGVTCNDVAEGLTRLCHKKIVFRFNDLYSISGQEEDAARRRRGNIEAVRLSPMAFRRASLISKFPFVRAVMASGSFSKDFMDKDSDLDFFVVTVPGRLWIARTLLVLYKRLVFFNSHKFFCINYLVDEDHLLIEDQNQFTAIELATLIPLRNGALYLKLIESNAWITKVFPNLVVRDVRSVPPDRSGFVKRTMERCLSTFAPWLDTLLMNLTRGRFRRIYASQYDDATFQRAFRTVKYSSKNHPKNYQGKVMKIFEQKLNSFMSGNESQLVS